MTAHTAEPLPPQANLPSSPSDPPPEASFPPKLRPQSLPLHPKIRSLRPSAKNVVVLAPGSYGLRYGFASDSTPKRVYPAVAFRRRVPGPGIIVPPIVKRSEEEKHKAKQEFETVKIAVAEELALHDRRRGGGRPIPWKVQLERVIRAQENEKPKVEKKELDGDVLVGADVERLMLDKERRALYDIVFPLWDGRVLTGCGSSQKLVEKALSVLLDHVVNRLKMERQRKGDMQVEGEGLELFKEDGLAKTYVALVVPETSQRRDVAAFIRSIFESRSLQTAAIFVHQSAVSCALGAGLATCTVVDIGHSATTIACVDDGMVMGETRVHLEYGSWHIQSAFEMLLESTSNLHRFLETMPGVDDKPLSPLEIAEDRNAVIAKIAEQTGGFDPEENDTLTVAIVKLPSGRDLRVMLGLGIKSIPCYGLVHPKLLTSSMICMRDKREVFERDRYNRNSDDDNFACIYNELKRTGIASAALPMGVFANDRGQPAEKTLDKRFASVVDAVIWSVGKAVELKKPEQSRAVENYRRYVNAIVLAGGGASIDGIALALEARIKKGFLDIGLNVADVTVIDGGKGKGDEELQAAAAVLKDTSTPGDLVDDTDTASLPWKGGAVMVEADALNEYWVYRDDWEVKDVRAIREKAPFYW